MELVRGSAVGACKLEELDGAVLLAEDGSTDGEEAAAGGDSIEEAGIGVDEGVDPWDNGNQVLGFP